MGRVLDRAHERTVAKRLPTLNGQRRVEVGRVEGSAPLDCECTLGQKRPIHLLIKALHDGSGLVVSTINENEATLFQREAQTRTTNHKDLRAFLKLLSHDRGNIHGGGHNHVSRRIKVHAVELLGHLRRRTHCVVRDEGRSHTKLTRFNDGRSRMLDTLVARPRGAIKVKESTIVVLGEGVAGATQRRTLPIDI